MLFNTFDFIGFFFVVWLIYLNLTKRAQNLFLLLASLYFYGYSNLNFLWLVILSLFSSYFFSRIIARNNSSIFQKKLYLTISVLIQLGILFLFKGFHFFTDDIKFKLASFFGPINLDGLDIIIPLGLSFYSFQLIGYLVDVYKGDLKVEKNIIDYSLFITFFPQLMAGPIERGRDLLAQIKMKREINKDILFTGLGLLIWGYFQKVVIADNLAPYYRDFFNNPSPQNTITSLLAIYVGIIRVYCDFAGYSNIARGLGHLLGFKLSLNFDNPLFSTGPIQLWKRWHITLVRWFTNYCFHPVLKFFNRYISFNKSAVISLLTTTTLIGVWHGLSLKFILWGFSNGILYLTYRLIPKINFLSKIEIPKWLQNFVWINLWGFFGLLYLAQDLKDIPLHLENLTRGWGPVREDLYLSVIIFGGILLIVELFHEKNKEDYLFSKRSYVFRSTVMFILFVIIYFSGSINENPFVYFVF